MSNVPPAPPQPPPTAEQAAKERDDRQHRMDCAQFVSSPLGQRIMDVLRHRYGFAPDNTELPIYVPGLDAATVAHRDGMREPVRHLLRMSAPLPDKPQPKPTTATT